MATEEKQEIKVPEGAVVRDDGCICPPAEEKPPQYPDPSVCPYDPRFPNANQTKHCYFSFIDYQRCARLLGDYPGCFIFYKCYTQLCPSAWVEKWFEQMESGIFPRKIYPPRPIIYPDPKKMTAMSLEEEEEEEEIC